MIRCALTGHKPDSTTVWNDGIWFGHCRHCGRELIQRCGDWKPVPRGMRVVWRPRGEEPKKVLKQAAAHGISEILMSRDFSAAWDEAATAPTVPEEGPAGPSSEACVS